MKNFHILLTAILVISSCTGTSETGSITSNSTEDTNLSSNIETGGATLTQASIIAHDFVKDNFASDCDFDDLDIRGEAVDAVQGRFKVLQKFTSSKYGSEQEYVYKIYIQYYGGEWEDKNNWDYGELTIENTSTQQQYHFNGTMKELDLQASSLGKKTIAGVEFKESFVKEVIIYSTPKQIEIEKLRAVAQELKGNPKTIMFYIDSEIEGGEEYASVIGNNFFYHPLNKIESLK